jgi:hypothetical protein
MDLSRNGADAAIFPYRLRSIYRSTQDEGHVQSTSFEIVGFSSMSRSCFRRPETYQPLTKDTATRDLFTEDH